MALRSFRPSDLLTVGEALDIAEDATGNFFKFSHRQWKRHRYDVKTLPMLSVEEIAEGVFAVLNKGTACWGFRGNGSRVEDHYFICVQDHQVLDALKRDQDLNLLSLMTYVFTHELIHVVRFSNFFQRFEAPAFKREEEEKIVHGITHEVLKRVFVPKMEYVLEAYRGSHVCEVSRQYQ